MLFVSAKFPTQVAHTLLDEQYMQLVTLQGMQVVRFVRYVLLAGQTQFPDTTMNVVSGQEHELEAKFNVKLPVHS